MKKLTILIGFLSIILFTSCDKSDYSIDPDVKKSELTYSNIIKAQDYFCDNFQENTIIIRQGAYDYVIDRNMELKGKFENNYDNTTLAIVLFSGIAFFFIGLTTGALSN